MLPWIFWAYNQGVQDNLRTPPSAATNARPSVNALIRPHPLAIAGTPTAQHFDPATDTLTSSYSTVRGGGSFAADAVTSFQVQKQRYPMGYSVTVTGGKVTSTPDSALLTVVANPGAASVSVTVVPIGAPTKTPAPTTPPAMAVVRQPTFTG